MNYENCSLKYQHISPKPPDDKHFGLFTIYTADIDTMIKFVWFFGTWCAINTVLIIYIIFRLEVKDLKIPSIKIGKSKKKGRSDLVIFLIVLLTILIIYFIVSTITLAP